MTSIYEIIRNDTVQDAYTSSFVWNHVWKHSDPCSWEGVGCTPDNSSITTISFHSFSLPTSEFLPFLCNISTLESIDVSHNQLTSIPNAFFTACGEISALKLLNFSMNRLSGSLPTFNNGLKALENLDFYRNFLSGEIRLQLKELDSLKILNLGWNQFSGKIPTNLGKWNLLENLLLSNNHFSAPIPIQITKHKNLSLVDFSQNLISFSIPQEFGELTKLQTLDLSYNNLIGGIPSSLSNITTLESFAAELNYLDGKIPPLLTRHLKHLYLSFNNLTGFMPPHCLPAPDLQSLYLSFNDLVGAIPTFNSTAMLYLEMDNNRLGGSLPPSLGNLTNLQVLSLSNNLFVGPIPSTLSTPWNLQVLDLSNNGLSGEIPSFLAESPLLAQLLLMNNNLSGAVPRFGDHVLVDTSGNKDLIYPSLTPQSKRKQAVFNSEIAIPVVSGFPVGLVISVIAIFISKRYKSIHHHLSPPSSILRSAIDLKRGMEAVSDPSNITHEARFSTFYKAIMPSGSTYLVKKISHSHNILKFPRNGELSEELQVLGNLSHPNVMIPKAYVLTPRRAYLFYDFARGTLHDILHHRTGNATLGWSSRYSIAVGVAKGLAYLHECSSGPVLLLDLCTKSVLLKSLDEPQIGDVELCKFIHPSRGTERVTAAGNVYSYGVLLLELLSGKPAVSDGGTELAEWALTLSEDKSQRGKILDSSIEETSVGVRRQMLGVLEVALACVSISPEKRPNAVTVRQMLQRS